MCSLFTTACCCCSGEGEKRGCMDLAHWWLLLGEMWLGPGVLARSGSHNWSPTILGPILTPRLPALTHTHIAAFSADLGPIHKHLTSTYEMFYH